MKISISGHYYESADNQVDADGYNENTTKKRESTDKDAKGELERINCSFKDALLKLQAEQQFDKVIKNAEGEYKEITNGLLYQCEALIDLINGSIVGQNCKLVNYLEITHDDINSQLGEIQGIKKQLIDMDQQILKKNNKLDISQYIARLQIINQEQQQSEQIDLNLSLVDDSDLKQFEERIEKLNHQVGMQLVKQNQSGDAFFFRGSEIFCGNEKVSERKEKNDYNLIGQLSYQLQENEPQNLISHIQMLKIQAKLMNNDDETSHQLTKIQEIQDQISKQDPTQMDLTSQFQVIQKKHEFTLNSIDEIPKIIQRLSSLQQLHSQTIQLPHQLDETCRQLDWMMQVLEEGSEIITILEKE